MKVIAIAAVGKNGVIGKGSELPWNIPEDMKFFRDSTREQIVIMGRKTYQSLGKALPKRENAVITRDPNFKVDDAYVFHDLLEAVDFFKKREDLAGKTIFIIGGAEIYSLSIPWLDEVWLTEINSEFEGDIYFPHYHNGVLELVEFKKTSSKAQADFKATPFNYHFSVYSKLR